MHGNRKRVHRRLAHASIDGWLSMTDTNELGMLLRRRRKLLGKTLADVSKASGVDISSISAYERGTISPTSERLLAILDALGVDLLGELRK